MLKKWLITLGLLFLMLMWAPVSSEAAIPDADLEAFTQEIGWPEWMLDLYISYKSEGARALDSFHSIEELESYLGPRLTDEQAFEDMLNRNNLTRAELEELLAQNDTSLEEYTFVQELEDDLPLLYADLQPVPIETENGGQLPDTAGGYAVYALLGLLLGLIGIGAVWKGWRLRTS